MQTKKLILPILFLINISIAYADTRNALTNINDFFINERYSFYSGIIDFAILFIFFTAVTYIGVSKAFHGSRQAKAIAVILGLTFTVMLMNAGLSIVLFLPYLIYLLFIFLVGFVFFTLTKTVIFEKRKLIALIAAIIAVSIIFFFYALLVGSGSTLEDNLEIMLYNWGLL